MWHVLPCLDQASETLRSMLVRRQIATSGRTRNIMFILYIEFFLFLILN